MIFPEAAETSVEAIAPTEVYAHHLAVMSLTIPGITIWSTTRAGVSSLTRGQMRDASMTPEGVTT